MNYPDLGSRLFAKMKQKRYRTILIAGVLITTLLTFKFAFNKIEAAGTVKSAKTSQAASGGLKILKSEVSNVAKFYPYKSGSTYMEVIAVKATDGSIRTALNTCQVCYNSGRGFYTQEGDELVCNNCGNRFQIDQIEKIKYGCNPVPIVGKDKTDDGKYITISKSYLDKNKGLFSRWKR